MQPGLRRHPPSPHLHPHTYLGNADGAHAHFDELLNLHLHTFLTLYSHFPHNCPYLGNADGAHAHFDELLPVLARRQHDLIRNTALGVTQRQRGVPLRVPLHRA